MVVTINNIDYIVRDYRLFAYGLEFLRQCEQIEIMSNPQIRSICVKEKST